MFSSLLCKLLPLVQLLAFQVVKIVTTSCILTLLYHTAVCSRPCVHGLCVGPNECSCHHGWKGPSCREGNKVSSSCMHCHSERHALQTKLPYPKALITCGAVMWRLFYHLSVSQNARIEVTLLHRKQPNFCRKEMNCLDIHLAVCFPPVNMGRCWTTLCHCAARWGGHKCGEGHVC